MITDCHNNPVPVFATGTVDTCSKVDGAKPNGSVIKLCVILKKDSQKPAAGQFYMLHAVRSDVLLGRPISVYHSEVFWK